MQRIGRHSTPPGGAMEAPKDPDTRPGPPPSANVPLGKGMYCASACQHRFSAAEWQQLLYGGLLQAFYHSSPLLDSFQYMKG